MSVLSTSSLTKTFGSIQAVRELDLEIKEGMVLGILGPNGSGKTTTLGMVLDIIRPTSGAFVWFEGKYGSGARKHLGALLETPNFYPYLHAIDNLRIVAHIKKVPLPPYQELLELVNLWDRRHSKFRTYSLGMKQRLAIAATLIGDPEVLIFDEPTNGLDPRGIIEVRETLINIGKTGKTVIMASHILDEVEKICSHVAILKKGRLLAMGPIGAVMHPDEMLELSAENLDALYGLLAARPEVKKIEKLDSMLQVFLSSTISPAEINRWAFENGITLQHIRLRPKSLEQEFLEITKEQ